MSAPLSPAARTRTSTSPLPGTGSGCSSITSCSSRILTARIAAKAYPAQAAAPTPGRPRAGSSAPGHGEAEALDEPGHARGVHVERVPLAQAGDGLGVGLQDPSEVDELAEEALEPRRRDDLEDAALLLAGVPEGVPLTPR